eukprot:GHVN01090000.1.p1 GENE.GHVN01090000.1~~GHVN01090000.1.p1  ORF type:complete len:414 (+),score=67.42 GHVN01090000.1:1357-2598(+)
MRSSNHSTASSQVLCGALFTKQRRRFGVYLRPTRDYYGASYLVPPKVKDVYERRNDSLHHYPHVKLSPTANDTTKVDWVMGVPSGGYEQAYAMGPNTIELKMLPFGMTPELLQERLRRWFSKYAPVKDCRVLPHAQDLYQSSGVGYVTLDSPQGVSEALRHPLIFPKELNGRGVEVTMRALDTDEVNDDDAARKRLSWARVACQGVVPELYHYLTNRGPLPLSLLSERIEALNSLDDVFPAKWTSTRQLSVVMKTKPRPNSVNGGRLKFLTCRGDEAVVNTFGSWEVFLQCDELKGLFKVVVIAEPQSPQSPQMIVVPRIASTLLVKACARTLEDALVSQWRREVFVPWRQNKRDLPQYTQDRIKEWEYKAPLDPMLQLQSIPSDEPYEERQVYLVLKDQQQRRLNQQAAESK